MAYVGMDCSFSGFGLALVEEGGEPALWRSPFPKAKLGAGGLRLNAVRSWLRDCLEGCSQVDLVAIEGYAFGSRNGREQAGEVGGIARLVAYELSGKEPLIVAPTTAKKFLTGSGRADKDEVVKAVEEMYGHIVPSHDMADALNLAMIARAFCTGDTLNEAQAGIIAGLK